MSRHKFDKQMNNKVVVKEEENMSTDTEDSVTNRNNSNLRKHKSQFIDDRSKKEKKNNMNQKIPPLSAGEESKTTLTDEVKKENTDALGISNINRYWCVGTRCSHGGLPKNVWKKLETFYAMYNVSSNYCYSYL